MTTMPADAPMRPRARQARILDWMRHGGNLPDDPAIDRPAAAWTAQEMVDGLHVHPSRGACLADLHALRDRGVIRRVGRDRWQYARPGADDAA
jgi:hypothetical protein